MGTWIPSCCNMDVYIIAKFLFRGCENKKQRLGEMSHHKSICHLRGWLDIFTTMERDVVQSKIGHKPLAMSTKPCVPTSVLASVLTNNNGTYIWIQKAQHWYLSDFSIHITYILLRGDNSHQYLVAKKPRCFRGLLWGVFVWVVFVLYSRPFRTWNICAVAMGCFSAQFRDAWLQPTPNNPNSPNASVYENPRS